MFREREGLNNTTAKDVQIDLPANTHQSSTPDTDVVFQTEFQSEKPTAETLRESSSQKPKPAKCFAVSIFGSANLYARRADRDVGVGCQIGRGR